MKIDKELDKLQALHDNAMAEIRAGMIDMATGIQGAAQSVAPVDTGYMRDHIFVKPKDRSQISESSPFVYIESEAEYSYFVEYGSRESEAQPFLRPAYEQSKDSSLARLRARLKKRLG